MSKPSPHRDYLGDGVYADFDGYHVVLKANSLDGPNVIYLDPYVRQALARYVERVTAAPAEQPPVSVLTTS